jgi:hypothetical protein
VKDSPFVPAPSALNYSSLELLYSFPYFLPLS